MVSQTIEIPQFWDKVVDVPVVQVVRFHRSFISPSWAEAVPWSRLFVGQWVVFLWEMTSCLSPYSALSLVRLRIHALRKSTELFEEAHIFST